MGAMRIDYGALLKATLLVVGVALLPFLVWYLFDVILIAFGAIIIATLLWLVAEPMIRWLSFREGIALVLSGIVILLAILAIGFEFGTRVADQLQDVMQKVSEGAATLQASLQTSELGKFASRFTGSGFSLTEFLAGMLKISSNLIEGVTVALITGIYLAAQPRLYRDGFVMLFPPHLHCYVAERIDAIGAALRLWLIGQLLQMALIGALAMLVVWIIGVPSPIALGLIAGAGEFVPYIGPIVAAIPAILVAATVSWETALWTVAGYLVINQVEGHLIVPLIQRRLVSIPPAVILLGIVAITALFGVEAIVFAAPMTVVLFVAVKVFYVRDKLGEPTEIPGETS
jgi:predicted PurR-regulated permease PerM